MAKQRSGFFEFLHHRRLVLRRKWKDVLSDAYLSRATLHRIQHGDPHHPLAEADSLRALANALKFQTWAEMVTAYDAQDPRKGLDEQRKTQQQPRVVSEPSQEKDAVLTLSRALNLTPTELVRRLSLAPHSSSEPPGFPSGLRPWELRPARPVPHFASAAASARVETLDDEHPESRQLIGTDDARVFTIPVDGDCQSPVWNHGDIVLFSFDAYEREGILEGKSYYLAFTDGTATFKRVFLDKKDPEIHILRCWNNRKYPIQRRVRRNEVVRIARAISKQVVPEEEGM